MKNLQQDNDDIVDPVVRLQLPLCVGDHQVTSIPTDVWQPFHQPAIPQTAMVSADIPDVGERL